MDITVKIDYANQTLKPLREKAGLSQSQLAMAAGINVRVLQSYEQGDRNLNGAKLVTLLRLANALQCPLRKLITDPEALTLMQTTEI